MADIDTLAVLADLVVGTMALAGVANLRRSMTLVKRRLHIVEKRTTPPPGELPTITDIASGPVRRAATEPPR